MIGIILGILFEYNMKEIKKLEKNKELDEISKKYPSNIELCKVYLKKLNKDRKSVV